MWQFRLFTVRARFYHVSWPGVGIREASITAASRFGILTKCLLARANFDGMGSREIISEDQSVKQMKLEQEAAFITGQVLRKICESLSIKELET